MLHIASVCTPCCMLLRVVGNCLKPVKLFFFNNNTTLLMTIITFTWRENKNNVQERKAKYDVTAFTTN